MGYLRCARVKRAFTLVELLVVIGIIAVLTSILIPSIVKARYRALDLSCKSNMRQIGIYMQLYQQKFGALMPSSAIAVEKLGYTRHASFQHPSGSGSWWVRLGTLYGGGILTPGAAKVLYCPIYSLSPKAPPPPFAPYLYKQSDWDPSIPGTSVSYSLRDFTVDYNSRLESLKTYYISGVVTPITQGTSSHTIKNSTQGLKGRRTIVSDICEFSPANFSGAYEYHSFFAHDGKDGYNFLFTDGSVDHLPLKTIERVFGPKVAFKTGIYAGREHFAQADYLFGNP